MEKLTPEMILTTLVVISIVCSFIVLLGNVIKTVSDWRKPNKDIDKRIGSLEARVGILEGRTGDLSRGQKAMLGGIMALLEHELHNGNSLEMEEASKEINNYLIGRTN